MAHKVVIINKSDSTGGAAVVSTRLLHALRAEGVDARMLVQEKLTDSPYIERVGEGPAGKIPFLAERLQIFAANGLDRRDLFKVDTASVGLPLARHPRVREADTVILGWVNQGLLSLRQIGRMAQQGKRVLWVMHDMWCATGICHHAGSCSRYRQGCGQCHLLHGCRGANDLSARVFRKKKRLYTSVPITFVPVSGWLEGRCRESGLLRGADIRCIPNAVPDRVLEARPRSESDRYRLIMGAARLDDPIKGLPLLTEALALLPDDLRDRTELTLFGTIRDASLLERIPVKCSHLGRIDDMDRLLQLYARHDAVVSPSLFETLPGTLIEGMAQGCVPVAFASGGQADIVDHLSTGYLATLPAALADLGRQPSPDETAQAAQALADGLVWTRANADQQMRQRCRQSVSERFSARSVARRFISLFSDK